MARELLNDSSSDSSDSEAGGAEVPTITVNADYAKKFEHNKKREELQRLEEKLGKSSKKRKRGNNNDGGESESDSSSSEDEDDAGEFATAALDSEILATLNAIKSKDPRVYDDSTTFYSEFDVNNAAPTKEQKEKPMYLRDYHRENLLNGVQPGNADGDGDRDVIPLSYHQEQEQLKKSIVSEMHAAADGSDESDSDPEGGLLVRKPKHKLTTKKPAAALDVDNADRDPETFLSNFMASRAWVPTDRAELHPFESDDSEQEKHAEEYEEAYNMRFENPEKSNEKLRSHARDVAARFSVRREEKNSRNKKRDAEKAAKAAAKQELKDEKSRLKKLRMEEVEEKVKRIKRAAGLKSGDLQPEDWAHFIDDEWDDTKWEAEMQTRFGDHYYAEEDQLSLGDDEDQSEDSDGVTKKKSKKKTRKPRFDNDIDIKDIIPDFKEDEEEAGNFSLSEDENGSQDIVQDESVSRQPKKKSKKQERIDKQRESKKERRIIEQLVDDQLQLDLDRALPSTSRQKSVGFRYRETSPQSFGMTPRDILLADDTALNQFAGLKKLASWRDEEKKRKDKKHLGKKARLRKWRMETFGDEEGAERSQLVADDKSGRSNGLVDRDGSDEDIGGVNIREDGKKKKARRRKKAKTTSDAVVAEA